jgi:hypothetical protein
MFSCYRSLTPEKFNFFTSSWSPKLPAVNLHSLRTAAWQVEQQITLKGASGGNP